MTRSEKKKRYDGMLIFVVLLLVAAGLVILYSNKRLQWAGEISRSVSLFEKAGVCDTARTVWYGAYRPR